MAKRIIDEVVKTAALEELRNGTPQREVAKIYGIAESTVSRWRKAANIEGTHAGAAVRSRPLKSDVDKNGSLAEPASADRRKMIDRMVALVTDLAEGGNLRSHDVKNLSVASKALNEASARLEQEEQSRAVIQQHASSPNRSPSRQDQLVDLVAVDQRGAPLNIEVYFAVTDVEEARECGQEDKEGEAWARLCEILRSYGITKLTEADFETMVNKSRNDFAKEMAAQGRTLESEGLS
jgi:hypothetical protein